MSYKYIYLNDSLSVRLKSKLCDDRQLNLCTQGKHNLLISDHAITSLLFGHMDPGYDVILYHCQARVHVISR